MNPPAIPVGGFFNVARFDALELGVKADIAPGMITVRTSLAVTLALLFLWSSAGVAAIRTLPGAAGTMVICTGAGPVTIVIDGEGQPAATRHICPDCLTHHIDTVLPVFGAPLRAPEFTWFRPLLPLAVAPPIRPVQISARGPPLSCLKHQP
ncbi:hypothetical protein SAMN05421688_2912 [Poseidonocella pacifica]|uniref:DUF2946 domain-containing protein n=1 Tax=Poseidonocella pacifica TaxID=871651 RepID=A0A1I0YDJ8_9RHOB|nr:hypothetical protein SAMN05421688_2912 [Poseidonocella pacifica]